MSCGAGELCSLAEAIEFEAMAEVVIPVAAALVALFVIVRAIRIVMQFVRGDAPEPAGYYDGAVPDEDAWVEQNARDLGAQYVAESQEEDDGERAYWSYMDAHDPYANVTAEDYERMERDERSAPL